MPTLDLDPVKTKDPVPMSEVKISATKRDEFIRECIAQYKAQPEHFHEPGKCKDCHVSFGPDYADWCWDMSPFGFWLETLCEPCKDKRKKEFELEEQRARDRKFAGIIPAEFITWDRGKGNERLLAAVNGAFSFTNRRGLVLHGTSGQCKTRVLWQIIKRITEQPEGFSWLMLDAFECATTGIPPDAAKVDFLFIDDLGNEPKSAKFETGLLHLIRKRCEWHKPIFISTQCTGQGFRDQYFSQQAGLAILRRLKERADFISADSMNPKRV